MSAEQQVLDVLREHGGPLDAIGISSRCRLEVETVLQALQTLTRRNLVSQAPPEPVHERFAPASVSDADTEALLSVPEKPEADYPEGTGPHGC